AREKGDRAGEEQRQQSLTELEQESRRIRKEAQGLIKKSNPAADLNDNDRVFLTFVIQYMPRGLVGLLMAVILATAMSSISAAISSLSTTTVIDVYRRSIAPSETDAHYVKVSRFLNFGWCVLCILIALLAGNFGNLIQAVNILGSLFYGTLLGIFVVGFFLRSIGGTAVFWAAVISELIVVAMFILPAKWPDLFGWLDIGYLWYNLIGCLCVMALGGLVQLLLNKQGPKMQQS
ncbi:MAG: sodium:solute symporter, partial [Bacteroidetes bacterium]